MSFATGQVEKVAGLEDVHFPGDPWIASLSGRTKLLVVAARPEGLL